MSLISNFFKLSSEDFYWILQFGKPKLQASILDLRYHNSLSKLNPVFFLSTGRCGTKWFSELLKHDKAVKVFHNPLPNLGYQSKLLYSVLRDSENKLTEHDEILFTEMYLTAREQMLRYSYKTNRRIIETNSNITFFAPILAKLFPKAKFVHLIRHPGQYVRSGIRRKYYNPNNTQDLKRIKSADSEKWDNYSAIQKCSWLWNETNSFIENFKQEYPDSATYTFNFNELNTNNVKGLLDFLEVKIRENLVQKSLGVKRNSQQVGAFKSFSEWEEKDKNDLRIICGELMKKYNYSGI